MFSSALKHIAFVFTCPTTNFHVWDLFSLIADQIHKHTKCTCIYVMCCNATDKKSVLKWQKFFSLSVAPNKRKHIMQSRMWRKFRYSEHSLNFKFYFTFFSVFCCFVVGISLIPSTFNKFKTYRSVFFILSFIRSIESKSGFL